MSYSKEMGKVHRMIRKAGQNATLTFMEYQEPDRQTGETPPPVGHPMYFCQARYSNQELEDQSISNGNTKILVSPIGADGKPIENFAQILKKKTAKVILPSTNGQQINVSTVVVTSPDSVTPILGRVFLEA